MLKQQYKSKQLIIEMLSLPAGSGKTHVTVENIVHLLESTSKKFIIALPTNEFSKEWLAKLSSHDVSFIEIINSDNKQNPDTVCKNIEAALLKCNQLDSECRVIIISHNALVLSNFGSIVNDWDLIIDETLATFEFRGFNIAVSKSSFDTAIFKEDLGKYYCITKSNIADATRYDDHIKSVHEQLTKLSNYDCFISKQCYERILTKTDTDKAERNIVTMLGLLKPDFLYNFKSVKILAANFEDSILYQHFSKNHGVKFITDERLLTKITRHRAHTNGHLLTIKYFDIELFTKNLAIKQLKNNKLVYQNMLDKMFEILGNDFCYASNKDFKHNKPLNQAIEKMPVKSMGQNRFADYAKMGYLVQLNLDKTKLSMLADFSLSGGEIWRAINGENVYQSVTRTAIRNPDSNTPVLVVVADKKQAEFIAEKFTGCKLEPIEVSFLSDIVSNVFLIKGNEKKQAGRKKQTLSVKELKAKQAKINEQTKLRLAKDQH